MAHVITSGSWPERYYEAVAVAADDEEEVSEAEQALFDKRVAALANLKSLAV